MRVALLYEHPTWSLELLSRLAERSVTVTAIDVGDPTHASLAAEPHDLWINRINIMPSEERLPSVSTAARGLLASLRDQNQTVVNGFDAHTIGLSKLAQYELIAGLGLPTPATVGIKATRPERTLEAAERLGYPVLTKPNVGGSGAGIARFNDAAELQTAVAAGAVDLGASGEGVVQQVIESADGFVHRVEMLHGQLFYATKQAVQTGVYNYCAADGCAVDPDSQQPIEVVEPDQEIVEQVAAIVAGSGADVAGVEYLIDRESGQPSFYDFNPYSNFIAGQNQRLGFDPIERFLDAVLSIETPTAAS